MKKFTLSLLTLLVLVSCTDNKMFNIEGRLQDGVSVDKIYIGVLDSTQEELAFVDSIDVVNGEFSYSYEAAEVATIQMVGGSNAESEFQLSSIVVPGETLKLIVNKDDVEYSGSTIYVQSNEAYKSLHDYDINFSQGVRAYEEKANDADADVDKLRHEFMEYIDEMGAKQISIVKNYIKAHSDEEGAVILLTQVLWSDEFEDIVSLFSDNVRQGRLKTYIESLIEVAKVKSAEYNEADESDASSDEDIQGEQLPDFTLNDIDGKPLKLSSLRGKYVVLDFWGTWCVWCMKGMPKMKEYYTKYAGKFEIVGIDTGDTMQEWKAAVKEHSLTWKHVFCPEGNSLLDQYDISAFPTKMVIDPEGNMIYRVEGEDPAFYAFLDKLFK